MARVVLTGTLVCTDDAQAAVVRRCLPMHAALSRAEPGCISFEVTPTDDPWVWQVEETFLDARSFEGHQARARTSEWGRSTVGIERRCTVTGLEG